MPRVPHPRFVGKTALGPRGDVIVEADWSVGEILGALDRLKLSNNTIVIFTSDNGPVVDDGYQDDAVAKLGSHTPSGPFRGGKYSHFEGGTRVPFIVRWPARVKPGTSDALVSQVDFLASFASFLKRPLAAGDGPDSVDVMGALLGTSRIGRTELIEQAGGQALRVGQWKFIEASKRPKMNTQTNTELGNDAVPQLYDLSRDPGERQNLADAHPEKVKEMQARLDVHSSASRRPLSRAPSGVDRHDLVNLDAWHRDGEHSDCLPCRAPSFRRSGAGPSAARAPAGRRTRTVSGPTGMTSRSGPFIIIGLVRLTRCTVIDSRCRQAVTSITPRPSTSTGGGSLAAHVDDVAQQPAVVDAHHLPERAVDVPGDVGDAAPAEVAQVELAACRSSARAGRRPPSAGPDTTESASTVTGTAASAAPRSGTRR